MIKSYYKCARDYIGLKIDDLDDHKAKEVLSSVYSLDLIKGILIDFSTTENIFSRYGSLECFKCTDCKLNNFCLYDKTRLIYKSLKKAKLNNPIDQLSLI